MAKKSSIPSPRETQYWMVSPNVKYNDDTVEKWSKASVRYHVAFMGYEPDDPDHISGLKFAGTQKPHILGIMPDDRILIARRHGGEPQAVAFGVVKGKYETALEGFMPPDDDETFGSLRKLEPFKSCTMPPPSILLEVLPRNRALTRLHRDEDVAHKKVCDWIDKYLGNKNSETGKERHAITESKDERKLGFKSAAIVEPPKNHKSGYEVRTERQVIVAENTEAALVNSYERWLKKKGRKLMTQEYNERLQCDRYEVKRRNLIEAKASTSRENIRMEVGQLLDYAFLGKDEFGEPNKAILLPKKPHPEIVNWLRHLHISIVWREGESFKDNADGQFS